MTLSLISLLFILIGSFVIVILAVASRYAREIKAARGWIEGLGSLIGSSRRPVIPQALASAQRF